MLRVNESTETGHALICEVAYAWLKVSRSRLFVAVTVPALIGIGSARNAHVSMAVIPVVLVLLGLSAAELSSLFAWDYLYWKKGTRSGPQLPGNPVIPFSVLPGNYALVCSIISLVIGFVVFWYFILKCGWVISLFLIPAVIAGVLYANPFVPYGYFATAVIPPFIATGASYVLGSSVTSVSALAALPLVFSAAAIILDYRILPGASVNVGSVRKLMCVKQALFTCTYMIIIALIALRLLPFQALFCFLTIPLFFISAFTVPHPRHAMINSVSAGVAFHSFTGMFIFISYIL